MYGNGIVNGKLLNQSDCEATGKECIPAPGRKGKYITAEDLLSIANENNVSLSWQNDDLEIATDYRTCMSTLSGDDVTCSRVPGTSAADDKFVHDNKANPRIDCNGLNALYETLYSITLHAFDRTSVGCAYTNNVVVAEPIPVYHTEFDPPASVEATQTYFYARDGIVPTDVYVTVYKNQDGKFYNSSACEKPENCLSGSCVRKYPSEIYGTCQ